jgi:hypothetical protein
MRDITCSRRSIDIQGTPNAKQIAWTIVSKNNMQLPNGMEKTKNRGAARIRVQLPKKSRFMEVVRNWREPKA